MTTPDYEALTRELTERMAAAKKELPACRCVEDYMTCPKTTALEVRANALAALAAPAHEMAAVALAAAELSERGIDHQANGECLACKMRDALRSLQAVMLR